MTADLSATFESLGTLLSSHRPLTRVTLAALSFTLVVALSQQTVPATTAGPEQASLVPESLLPQSVGIAVPSDDPIVIAFEAPMDPAAVEAALELVPTQRFGVAWNADRTAITLRPAERWRTAERYLVVVGASATTAEGQALTSARRYTFSTQPAPEVTDFQVRLAVPADAAQDAAALGVLQADDDRPAPPPGTQPVTQTARRVSASSAITIRFGAPMDRADVESHFTITPAVEGGLRWTEAGDLVFEPTGRLAPGARYTISLIGAHDAIGNVLGGKANFSFVVQPGAQVTKTIPEDGAADLEPPTVEVWFSQPMDVDATNAAFALRDTSNGALVAGRLTWNEEKTQLIYTPDAAFAGGRTFTVEIGSGARDVDGNPVSGSWSFTTRAVPVAAPVTRAAPVAPPAPAPAPAPAPPPAAPATSLAGYALNQVNAARAAYGFAPVVLDASISAVAAAHAWDQANNGYFSHYSLDGRSRQDRLRAGGVSFSWSGENQCYYVGMSQQATLDWCHRQFMAEPYPGEFNHIANILNPNARRMGVGIATVGATTIITWNFTD